MGKRMKLFVKKLALRLIRNFISQLDDETLYNYGRLNPFYENLSDWKQRGNKWNGSNNITIYNSTTIVGDVLIGEHTWVGPFCSLDGSGGLKIGEYCSVSASVHILTHDTVDWATSGGQKPYRYAQTAIGDNCFIGTGSIILPGVTLGKKCVVGAGSVVNCSFPDGCRIAGVPARLIDLQK